MAGDSSYLPSRAGFTLCRMFFDSCVYRVPPGGWGRAEPVVRGRIAVPDAVAQPPEQQADRGCIGRVIEALGQAMGPLRDSNTRRSLRLFSRQRLDAAQVRAPSGEDKAGRDASGKASPLHFLLHELQDLVHASVYDLGQSALEHRSLALAAEAGPPHHVFLRHHLRQRVPVAVLDLLSRAKLRVQEQRKVIRNVVPADTQHLAEVDAAILIDDDVGRA